MSEKKERGRDNKRKREREEGRNGRFVQERKEKVSKLRNKKNHCKYKGSQKPVQE